VTPLLGFAVSAPAIDEKARQAWRRGITALNEHAWPPRHRVVGPSEEHEQSKEAVGVRSPDAAPWAQRVPQPLRKGGRAAEPWSGRSRGAQAWDYAWWPMRWRNWQG
jgi:hypothetical protein